MGKILKVNYPDRVVVAALYDCYAEQETERIDYLLPFLHDLVLDESEGKWVESPCYIRFGGEEES